VPSLLRDFSAPVILDYNWHNEDLSHLLAHDSDPFNRWEAGQRLASRLILAATVDIAAGRPAHWPLSFAEAALQVLLRADDDPAFAAEALTLPGEATLAEEIAIVDPDALHAARNGLRCFVAEQLQRELLQCYEALAPSGPYQPTPAAAGRRALRNLCLGYLSELDTAETRILAMQQFVSADNMTDQFAALATLAQHDCDERAQALAAFYARWHDEALVVDKWLSVQASSRSARNAGGGQELLGSPGLRSAQPEQGLRAAQHLRQQPCPFSCRRRQRLPLPGGADRRARSQQPAGGGTPGAAFRSLAQVRLWPSGIRASLARKSAGYRRPVVRRA
jgi:aminopeptidase N